MEVDPTALKADIEAEIASGNTALATAWREPDGDPPGTGDNNAIVQFYSADSRETAAAPLPAAELADLLRGEAWALKIFQAARSATPTTAGAADLFLKVAFGGGTISRADAAFVAAVQALTPGVLTAGEVDSVRALFVKSISRGVHRLGGKVTKAAVRAARSA